MYQVEGGLEVKKKNIRGMVFGLAATTIVTTTGCSEQNSSIPVSIPKTATVTNENVSSAYKDDVYSGFILEYKGQEYKEVHDPSNEYVVNKYTAISYDNGLNTDSVFFLRIDGNVYLATKVIDVDENNIISKYYAIDTGEFLGQTLDINWYSRATKDIETIVPLDSKQAEYKVLVDDNFKDYNYLNGEYGLGKNLCKESIISATSIFSEKVLTKKKIDSLLSDSLLTANLLENYQYPGHFTYSREDYTFVPFIHMGGAVGTGFNGKISEYYNKMYQFEIEDSYGTRKIFGYRSSANKNDVGFNCIYDIESSSYLDLSEFKVNVLDIKEVNDSKTVGEIRQETLEGYSIDDLNIVSTLNLEGDNVFKKYYITMRGDQVRYDTYDYKVLGEKAPVILLGNYDGSSLYFSKQEYSKRTPLNTANGIMLPLKECLKGNNLFGYVKDRYTENDLSLLITQLRKKELDLRTTVNEPSVSETVNEPSVSESVDEPSVSETVSETSVSCQKIRLEDIVVVDTSKESGDSVLIEAEQRYYVLIPGEPSPIQKIEGSDDKYYKTCDGTKSCGIYAMSTMIWILDINSNHTVYTVVKDYGELECITSFENALRENGLEDNICEEYSLIDLQILAEKINEKQEVLTLKQK